MTGHAQEQERIRRAYLDRVASGREKAGYFGYEDAAHVVRVHQRLRYTLAMLLGAGTGDLGDSRILDVGCGHGTMLLQYLSWGASPERLAGIDLREKPVVRARTLVPGADIRCACATALPWDSESFDLVSQHTVFSSILDTDMRQAVAGEMARVLAPGGVLLWYDTTRLNPGNPDVRAVSAQELRRLFPGFHVRTRRLTFLPHIARRLPVGFLAAAYPALTAVPWWCSHILAALTKRK